MDCTAPESLMGFLTQKGDPCVLYLQSMSYPSTKTWMRRFCILGAFAGARLSVALGAGAASPPNPPYEKQILPMLEEYCYDCHGDGEKKGDLALDKYTSLKEHLGNTE